MKIKNIALSILVFCLLSNAGICTQYKKSNNIAEINIALEKNDFKTADKLINNAISKNQNDVQLQLLSAISLIMQNKLDPAQDILDSIKKIALSHADLYYAQGAIYLKRIDTSDMRFRTKKDELIQLAINQLNYSLKICPTNARTYNALGVAELKREELFKAKKYFEKAIELNPNYSTALDNLGSIYYITNELDKALQYYLKANKSNSLSPTVYYHLAQVELKKDNIQKALYYANRSLSLNNDSAYSYNLIGEIYKKQGNEAAAIIAFKKSILAMPEYVNAYINLARIYEGRGDIDSAVEELKTCCSINSSDDSVKLCLADLVYASGQYEDALKYYSELSEKYKEESIEGLTSCYYALATESASKSIFKSNKTLKDSLVYINQAIKENPNNLELYLTKSKLVKLINNPIASKEVLLKIISAPNNNIPDMLTKGEAYLSLNQYRDARNIFTLAVRTDKDIENDLYLAEYFINTKQYPYAQEALNNVLSKSPNNYDALNNIAYINKMIDCSNQQYKNAIYLKKNCDVFFVKQYLNKSIKFNPNNIEANIMLGDIYKKEKKYNEANNCYKKVLGVSENEKQIKKIGKKVRKLDKKIAKIESKKNKKIKNDNKTDSSNIVPINNQKQDKE